MKETIKVYVRTRPTSAFASDSIVIDQSRGQIDLIFKGTKKDSAVSNAQERYPFSFTGILHNATQEAVYNTCCRSVITSAFEGYNGLFISSSSSSSLTLHLNCATFHPATIMAYGQTGAGKVSSFVLVVFFVIILFL